MNVGLFNKIECIEGNITINSKIYFLEPYNSNKVEN